MRAEIHNLGYRINRTMLAYLPKYIARRINATTSRIVAINVSPEELLSTELLFNLILVHSVNNIIFYGKTCYVVN